MAKTISILDCEIGTGEERGACIRLIYRKEERV